MRPRLLHLGSQSLDRKVSPKKLSFNEAEAFTPRIPRQEAWNRLKPTRRFNEAEAFTPRIQEKRNRQVVCRIRFNEAEAFTPRIHRVTRPNGATTGGFNEAEAFTPRIRKRLVNLQTFITYASMRPRLLHLGSNSCGPLITPI